MRLPWPLPDPTLAAALAECFTGPPARGPLPGGRSAALARLHAYDPAEYGRTRNHLDAPVSRLGAYLRHGMLSAVEVRDHLRNRFAREPQRLAEFLKQLAWRDFFDKVLDWYGDGLNDDLEESKHRVPHADPLPADVASGTTGLPCVDGMLNGLFATGYLHNHARLWFAAYLCHFRGVRWQEGARLFRRHLYDGDLASNSASWQWVESTFASKPYFMNKENVATFSGGRWCATCTVRCPFDAGYDQLQHTLFGVRSAPLAHLNRPAPPTVPAAVPGRPTDPRPLAPCREVVWVHDASLSAADPAVQANPSASLAFVFDTPARREEPWAFHRLAFVADGVTDLFATTPHPVKAVLAGDPVDKVLAFASEIGAGAVHVTDHPDPAVRRGIERLKEKTRVIVHPRPTLTDYRREPRRFNRYWEAVRGQVLGG